MSIPSRETFQSLVDLVKYCAESATYLHKQSVAIFKKEKKSDAFSGFLSALWNYAVNIGKQYSISAPFNGQRVIGPAETWAKIQCSESMPNPVPEGEAARELTFEIINQPEGKVGRVYRQSNGNYVSEQTCVYLDSLFQAWMAKNHIERKDNVMYGPNADGDRVRLSASELQSKMNHADDGFASYVQKETGNKYGIKDVTIAVERAAVVETQIPAAKIDAVQPNQPDAPSAGGSVAGGGMGGGH